MYDLSWSKNISNSNYNPIFISFLRWWNMLGKIINVMRGVKMNWSLYPKEAIQAVCLVSRMCFGSFLTVTSLQSTALAGGGESLCDPPDCVARRLAHLMELSAGVVRSVSFRHSTDCTLEPPASLEKILMPGAHFQRSLLNGYGHSILIFSSHVVHSRAVFVGCINCFLSDKSCVFINKLGKAASRGDLHCVSVTLSFGSEFLLWEKGRMESSVTWTSIYPLWHHFIALGPHSLFLWLIPSPRINNIHIVEVQKLKNRSVRWIPWVTELPSTLLPELHSSSVLTISSVSKRMKGGGGCESWSDASEITVEKVMFCLLTEAVI